MQPTMELRFIKRYEGTQLRFTLQQKWIRHVPLCEEWRDVPLFEEPMPQKEAPKKIEPFIGHKPHLAPEGN